MIWNDAMPKRFNSLILFISLAFVFARISESQVTFKPAGTDHISILIDGQPFSDFFIGSDYPKPFLAPLRTASGLIVTRQYPMKDVDGESRDHQHHRGLWIGYGNISGVNFWENEFSYKTNNRGKIVLRHIDGIKPGKRSGTLAATFEWRNPEGALMIEEHRTMTFSGGHDLRTIDIDATFTAKTNVKFEDTKEGFFAIRIADSMAEKNGGMMTNSEDAQTEKNVWGKRADWVDYDGSVDNAKVGIVIFDHPGNY
ncbi:MAG: PmoA family protein, partial [Acidobacteriota bacterium]|nr:PmoA family protein [Acidobacteriota bacterium]